MDIFTALIYCKAFLGKSILPLVMFYLSHKLIKMDVPKTKIHLHTSIPITNIFGRRRYLTIQNQSAYCLPCCAHLLDLP